MTMDAGEREALLRLMLDRAFKVGDFVLASGARSSYYFDGRLVTLDPLGALLIGREMAGWAREDAVAKVGGPTLGADPMVTATALNIGQIVRDEEPTHEATWNAICLADFGDSGVAFDAWR